MRNSSAGLVQSKPIWLFVLAAVSIIVFGSLLSTASAQSAGSGHLSTTVSVSSAFSALVKFFQGALSLNTTALQGPAPPASQASPTTTISNNPIYTLGLIAVNSQSSATGTNFQQMVTLSPSSLSSYEAGDLGNIRFYQGGTELYSWCQSGCSSSSGSAVFWVKIPNGISANSNLNITATFLPTSIEYDGVYAGEAPQLSSTYGKYDNGANVFGFYDNFAGSSLSSKWVNPGSGYVLNNGVTVNAAYIRSTSSFSPVNTYVEWYGYITQLSSGNVGMEISSSSFQGSTPQWLIKDGSECGYGYYWQEIWNGASATCSKIGTLSTSSPSLFTEGGGSSTGFTASTPGPSATYVDTLSGSSIGTNSYLWLQNNGGSTANLTVTYVRERQYPPSGVMPSISFSGSSTTVPTSTTSTTTSLTTSTTIPGSTSTTTIRQTGYTGINMSVGQNMSSGPWKLQLETFVVNNNRTPHIGMQIYYNGNVTNAYPTSGLYNFNGHIINISITSPHEIVIGNSSYYNWATVWAQYPPVPTVTIGNSITSGPWKVQLQDVSQSTNGINAPAAVAVYYNGQLTNESSVLPRITAKFNYSGHLLYLDVNSTTAGLYGYQKTATMEAWYVTGKSTITANTTTTTTIPPSNTVTSTNIKLINSQSTAVPAGFQQMITFSPSSFSSYEAGDLGNIRFYQGTNALYSWCESGCSPNAAVAVFWIRLPSGISANSNINITATFLPTSTEYDGAYAGEAPQLSSTYGKYDNGRKVFNLYDNFAGSTLNSTIWQACGSGCTVNNGLTDIGGIFRAQNTYNVTANTFDWYGYISSLSYGNAGVYIAAGVSHYFPEWMIKDGSECGFGYYWQESYNGASNCHSLGALSSTSPNILFSMYALSLSGYTTAVNYAPSGYISTQSQSTPNLYPIIQNNGGTSPNLAIQYARERFTPPNGIMPAVSFPGSITTSTTTVSTTTTSSTSTSSSISILSTSTTTIPVNISGGGYVMSALIGSVLNQGVQLGSPQATKALQGSTPYAFSETTAVTGSPSPYTSLGGVPLSTAPAAAANGGGVSFSTLSIAGITGYRYDNILKITSAQLPSLRSNYGANRETEYLWLTGFSVYDQQPGATNFRILDAGGAYQIIFNSPIANTTSGGSQAILQPISFMGANYTLINGTGVRATYYSQVNGNTIAGGKISIAQSTGPKTLYVGQTLNFGPWGIQLQDLAQSTNALNAPAAVAIYYNGQETNESTIIPGATAKFNYSGHIIFINVNSTFSGPYAYQKWANLQVYTNLMSLQNGRQVNATTDKGWYVQLLWTNTTGGTSANKLQSIIIYNYTPTALSPGQSFPILQPQSAYQVTFVGDTLGNNYDPVTLQTLAAYETYANTGTRNSGTPLISNITEPSQLLTVNSSIQNAFQYAGMSSSLLAYDLTPYVLNEYSNAQGAPSSSFVSLKYTGGPNASSLINYNRQYAVLVKGYTSGANAANGINLTEPTVTFISNSTTVRLPIALYSVTGIEIGNGMALPVYYGGGVNISVSTNNVVLASLDSSTTPAFLYYQPGKGYLGVANASNAAGGAYYNQQNGQLVPFYLSHGNKALSQPYTFELNEHPVPGNTIAMDGISVGLSAAAWQSQQGLVPYELNYTPTGGANNVSYIPSQIYWSNPSAAVNAQTGFRTEKGSIVASISPSQDVFDMATAVDQLQFEVQNKSSVQLPISITNGTQTQVCQVNPTSQINCFIGLNQNMLIGPWTIRFTGSGSSGPPSNISNMIDYGSFYIYYANSLINTKSTNIDTGASKLFAHGASTLNLTLDMLYSPVTLNASAVVTAIITNSTQSWTLQVRSGYNLVPTYGLTQSSLLGCQPNPSTLLNDMLNYNPSTGQYAPSYETAISYQGPNTITYNNDVNAYAGWFYSPINCTVQYVPNSIIYNYPPKQLDRGWNFLAVMPWMINQTIGNIFTNCSVSAMETYSSGTWSGATNATAYLEYDAPETITSQSVGLTLLASVASACTLHNGPVTPITPPPPPTVAVPFGQG